MASESGERFKDSLRKSEAGAGSQELLSDIRGEIDASIQDSAQVFADFEQENQEAFEQIKAEHTKLLDALDADEKMKIAHEIQQSIEGLVKRLTAQIQPKYQTGFLQTAAESEAARLVNNKVSFASVRQRQNPGMAAGGVSVCIAEWMRKPEGLEEYIADAIEQNPKLTGFRHLEGLLELDPAWDPKDAVKYHLARSVNGMISELTKQKFDIDVGGEWNNGYRLYAGSKMQIWENARAIIATELAKYFHSLRIESGLENGPYMQGWSTNVYFDKNKKKR